MDMFTMLSLSIFEYICLSIYLGLLFSVSFISIFRSCSCFIMFITKYLVFFGAIVNSIVYFLNFSFYMFIVSM